MCPVHLNFDDFNYHVSVLNDATDFHGEYCHSAFLLHFFYINFFIRTYVLIYSEYHCYLNDCCLSRRFCYGTSVTYPGAEILCVGPRIHASNVMQNLG